MRLAEVDEQARQDLLDCVGGVLDGVIASAFERAGGVGRPIKTFPYGIRQP